MRMKVLIRADASRLIGSGHIMRCITLANRLRQIGADCAFVCAALEGDLIGHVRTQGFPVFELSGKEDGGFVSEQVDAAFERDAQQTRQISMEFRADWIIVDHYDLGESWESAAVPDHVRLLVLDDLANRKHNADILVDQNYARIVEEYRGLVPSSCEVLTGSQYAILRQEFLTYRNSSLQRRRSGTLRSVLVSFGGADVDNITGQILHLFVDRGLSRLLRSLVVVLGPQSTWKQETVEAVAEFGTRGSLLCSVDNMAQIMSAADLSIGGGGTTAWERCVLGLPSLLLSIADNQLPICASLDDAGAAHFFGDARTSDWQSRLPDILQDLMESPNKLAAMSRRAGSICDGMGADRLVKRMVERG